MEDVVVALQAHFQVAYRRHERTFLQRGDCYGDISNDTHIHIRSTTSHGDRSQELSIQHTRLNARNKRPWLRGQLHGGVGRNSGSDVKSRYFPVRKNKQQMVVGVSVGNGGVDGFQGRINVCSAIGYECAQLAFKVCETFLR
jgi:hypothetical protein